VGPLSELVSTIGRVKSSSAVIAAAAALSGAIDFGGYRSGTVHMPAAWTAASIGFYVCDTETGTYQPLYEGATLVEMTVTVDRSYPLPAALAGCMWVKLWSQTAASGVNQVAEATIRLTLKG
jgi:hypothetical protein